MSEQPEQNVTLSNAETSLNSNLPPPPPSNATVNQLQSGATGSIPTSRSSGVPVVGGGNVAQNVAVANNPSNANMSGMMSLDSLMIEPQQNSGAAASSTSAGGANFLKSRKMTTKF